MILQMRGVRLRKITLNDIEMLRQWRNDAKIVERMFYKEVISPEMQLAWFNGLGVNDYYFVIEYNEEKIGLINVCIEKNKQDSGQVGLFVFEEKFWSTQIPVFASMCLLQFAFDELNLQEVKARVRLENTGAQMYNRQLGFTALKNEFQVLQRKNYLSVLAVLIKKVNKKKGA